MASFKDTEEGEEEKKGRLLFYKVVKPGQYMLSSSVPRGLTDKVNAYN